MDTGLSESELAMPGAVRWVADHLSRVIETGDTVLDLGCGGCEILAEMAREFPEAIFVGLHQGEMSSRALCRQAELLPNVSLLRGETDQLPFEDDTFDVLVCRFLLRLPVDLDRLVAEIARVCRPSGRVLLQDLAGLPDSGRSMALQISPELKTVCEALGQKGGHLFHGQSLAPALEDHGFREVRMVVQPCQAGHDSVDRLLWGAKVAAKRPELSREIGELRIDGVCESFLDYVCRPQPFISPVVCTVTASR